jgi:hypothetical protein
MKHSILTIFCFCDVAVEQRKYLAQDPNGEFMMVADKKSKSTINYAIR